MNENNEQNGGLFSDEYEAPKRENPYLKKNRDKAKAEKAEKPPKEKKPKRAVETESPYIAVEDKPLEPADKPAYAPSAPVREEGAGYVHKRTFSDWMFEHVKLIASVATALVILSLVLITDVVSVVENLITQTQQADREEISLTYVKGLSEKSEPISWGDLERFSYERTKAKDSVTWRLPVKGTAYELWISGVSTEKPPIYVYLYDMKTGDRLVIGEEDFDAFIEAHS
ncbi:MAG: hypothetical protein J6K29_11935 [Clostridia bacterium]|nr:hypothetical protein [Clostridia bacterium]